MQEYRYTVLNAKNPRLRSSIGWKYRCVCFTVLTVGLLIGVYFLVHGLTGYSTGHSHEYRFDKQKVLLISVDGLRYNVRQQNASTPSFDWFYKNGVSTDYVFNVFPTITIPNHQSIVTGLYSENHGLLGNKMYDRKTKEKFCMSNNQSKFWNDAIPIWIDNELQGHNSGVCFWPGYDVLYDGKQATYLPPNNYTSPLDEENLSKNMPWDMRADLAVDWLKKDDVSFVALYIDQPDVIEHEVGPDPSDIDGMRKLRTVIEKVDTVIGRVRHKINAEGLQSKVNVIVMGDHGQTNTDPSHKVVDLTKYVNLTTDAEFFGDGFVYAKPDMIEPIYRKLKKAEKIEGHFKVYLKKDIPEDLHIRNHERAGDIMFLPDPGWKLWQYGAFNASKLSLGTHGYDNKVKDMHPAFFAYGPLFRRHHHEKVIHTVDVYSLMCYILKIKPKRNDGDFNRIKSILLERYV